MLLLSFDQKGNGSYPTIIQCLLQDNINSNFQAIKHNGKEII